MINLLSLVNMKPPVAPLTGIGCFNEGYNTWVCKPLKYDQLNNMESLVLYIHLHTLQSEFTLQYVCLYLFTQNQLP